MLFGIFPKIDLRLDGITIAKWSKSEMQLLEAENIHLKRERNKVTQNLAKVGTKLWVLKSLRNDDSHSSKKVSYSIRDISRPLRDGGPKQSTIAMVAFVRTVS